MPNTLSPFISALSFPKVVYLQQGNSKRPFPDAVTLAFAIAEAHQTVRTLSDAALANIPTGPAVPSRRDDLLYKGTDGAIDLMRGGLRLRVPDVTTQRSLGVAGQPVIAISDADRAAIPAGAAFASASWFAQPPAAAVPIAFLPLRLETRFVTGADGKAELWVRAFPDEVHVDSFEPELTAQESAARHAYLADPDATAPDPNRQLAAWARVARRCGALRAAWIVSSGAAASGAKGSDWTRAGSTALLPDRLIFSAYDAEGGLVRVAGAEIADGLVLGPSPAGGDPAADEGLRWMRDFQRALDMGLAAKLPISASQLLNGFSRVVVFGVKSRLDPHQSAERLGHAIDAHHYTSGVELLPHGTPTNNTDSTKSGYRTDDPGFARSFAIERGAARTPSADGRADGDRLAHALGIAASHFAYVLGSDGHHDEAPHAMNAVLWPATLGYYLANLVNGAVPDPANVLSAARAHFIAWVRGRGPWPTLRIGRQPYGVIPVVSSTTYQSLEGGPLLPRLFALLQTLREFWQSSSGHVARVSPGADPDATLATVLSMSPSSTEYAGRTVLGPQFNEYYWRFLGKTVDSSWFTTLGQLGTSALGQSAATMAATRLGNSTYLGKHFRLATLVTRPLGDAPLGGNYLRVLAGMTVAQLRDAAPPASPAPLLWLLVRHAALRQYVDSAREMLGAALSPRDALEPELIDISPAVQTPRAWEQLAMALPSGVAAGAFLEQHTTDGPAAFVEFWNALGALAATPTTEVDRAARETIDLGSHRLDAWYTSLACQRLDTVRRLAGNQDTLYLGAYGWVENVRPQTATVSWGYVHAPSLGHAATAAVLRSGYLSHQASGSGAAAIELSSTRVRRAQHLLDGVRAGQALGAQLGYQFERALHERTMDVYIARFREFAPVESAAGDPVVDGVALLEKRTQIPWGEKRTQIPPGTVDFPPAGSPHYPTLTDELKGLADALDAVSDLMLAESVHQLVGGSALRAGATVDALGRGDTPPPVLDVTRTPRRGGVITHRLLVLLANGPAAGWPLTPRGRAEPRLDAFVARLLGAPGRVHAGARLLDVTGAVLSTVDITLADLGLGPLDVIALPERVPGARGHSEIEQRVARAAWAKRPVGTPADARVEIVLDRAPAWTPDRLAIDELLTVAASARALLSSARGASAVDLSSPDAAVAPAIDAVDLKARADVAVAALAAARTGLDAPTAHDAALDVAAHFGVEGAVPSLDAHAWPGQVARAAAALDARLAQLAALDAGFSRTGATTVALRDHDIERMRVVFGRGFAVVPRLTAAAAASITPLFASSATLLQNRPLEPVTWLARAARVRAGAARLDETLLLAESLSSGVTSEMSVAQLPAAAGGTWVGLPLTPGARPRDTLSIVALGAPATTHAVLFIDEWLETIPNASETTGVAFHVDDAKSRAPQAIVLGVQPDAFPEWTLESVEGTVLEAIALTHLRAVDPDALGAVGHFLPALFFAANFGSTPPDTVSTDLSLASPPSLAHPLPTSPVIGGLDATS